MDGAWSGAGRIQRGEHRMTREERLDFFLSMMRCRYSMDVWRYDSNMHLMKTSTVWNMLEKADFKEQVKGYLAKGGRTPAEIDTNLSIRWIVGFAWDRDELQEIIILGPFILGDEDQQVLIARMKDQDYRVELRKAILDHYSGIHVLTETALRSMAVWLHFTLNQENVSEDQIGMIGQSEQEASFPELLLRKKDYAQMWANEQKLTHMFETGSPDYKDKISYTSAFDEGFLPGTRDSLRAAKDYAITLFILCSRAAMRGGCQPAKVYRLSESCTVRIEQCVMVTETEMVAADFMNELSELVREQKQLAGVSLPVQQACWFIQEHTDDGEDISIGALARRSGYTKYYFSERFRRETGVTVSEYVLNERIARAKMLLAGSALSITKISEQLGFCSRSHFTARFTAKEGISPSEYRRIHGVAP